MLGPPDVNRIDRHLCEATLVIYGPSISSGGRGVERAEHLVLNALHGAGADAQLTGNFQDALAGQQLALDSFFQCWADLWPPELFALLYCPLKPGFDVAGSYCLKLCKGAGYLKH